MMTSCPKCALKTLLAKENCVIHTYKYLGWMTWMEAQCINCGSVFEQWLDHVYPEILEHTEDIPVMREEAPSESLIQQYNTNHAIELATEHELPPTLSAEADKFHEVLETIPDDLLLDLMQTPTRNERPHKWT